MEALDRQMVFAVKEEILRNVASTHAVLLIEGWERFIILMRAGVVFIRRRR